MDQNNNIPFCCCNNCKFTSQKGCTLEYPFKSKCLPDSTYSDTPQERNSLIYRNGIIFKRKYGYEYKYFEPKEEIFNRFSFIKKEEMEI